MRIVIKSPMKELREKLLHKKLSVITLFLFFSGLGVGLFFFTDRVAGLWMHPYHSAITGWDSTGYYLWLHTPLARGNFDFAADLQTMNTIPPEEKTDALLMKAQAGGSFHNQYGIGWALSGLPWYAVGEIFTRFANALGSNYPQDGYSAFYQFFLMLGQLVYAVISLYLSWKLIVELVPGSSALWGVLLTWLGSFMFYYQSSMMGMSHNMNFCFEITSFYCAREIERAPTKVWFWFGLGLFTALDSVTRYASSVLLVYPFVQFVRFGVLNKRWKEVMVVAAGFVLVISIQMLLWKIVFGQPIVNPYGASISWFQADFFQTFFSTFHGACYWHPILLPGWLLFIFWVFRHRSVAAWCWLTSAFLTTWVNAAWGPSTYGSSFGLRAFDGAVFFSMLGLAYGFSLLDSRPRQRVFVVMVLYLLCIWNVLLAYTARKNVLNTNAPYTYVQMWQVMEHFYLPTKA